MLMPLLRHPALLTASRRWLARHPAQTWLSIIGIALGVAVVLAVDLANESARRGFQRSLAQVTGPATHQIEAASGTIPEQTYADLRLTYRLRQATPVIDGSIRIGERRLTLLGTDPIAAAAMGNAQVAAPAPELIRLLTQPDSLALAPADADRLGVAAGDEISVDAAGQARSMTVVGLLPEAPGTPVEGLAVADIATAQEVFDRVGEIERIDLVLDADAAAMLTEALPQGLRLTTSAGRGNALEQMTRAFRTNLTAMSLLALLVGGFIVYNTMTFAVLQRRPLLGTLRMLGVSRRQLFSLVLTEALVLALVGALIGVLLGVVVGAGLVQLVTRTIDDLYFALDVRGLHLAPLSLVKGVGMGILVTLIAALGPALEAARSQPRDVIRRTLVERRGQRLLPWLALAGGLLVAVGLALVGLSGRSMTLGFVALFLVIIGVSLTVPLVVQGVAALTTPVFGGLFGTEGRFAARGIAASVTRTGLAVAALAVAVSATVGVGIMINSFRAGVDNWLAGTLSSDIYVAVDAGDGRPGGALPADLAGRIAALPGVEGVSQGRRVRVETRDGYQVPLLALSATYGHPRGFELLGEPAADLWPRWQAGELILVSEPFAYHRDVDLGDRVELFTAAGWRGFQVGAVVRDYGSDSGLLVLPRAVYAELWQDPSVASLGVVLADGADARAVSSRIEAGVAGLDQPLLIQANQSIRERSLEVFDRTFTITEVLRLLAVGVAFVGILSALMALELERGRDYAVLRATGMTRGQLARLILLQTSAMGIAAGLLAIPLGWIMGYMLIEVINLRSFGWTMPLRLPPATLAGGLVLAWCAALIAGLYPAWRATRVAPARALREE
jgi:putative ABC transport system permease protein